MNNKKKVSRINIYLTFEEKKQLTDLKNKYHVCFSTIADKIALNIWGEKGYLLTDHYLYDEKGYKTSIKPKFDNEEGKKCSYIQQFSKLSIYYTNVLKIFLKKEYTKYLNVDSKKAEQIHSRIHNSLKNTWDENWDGNDFCKKFPRFIKANPKYTKKLLGLESDE